MKVSYTQLKYLLKSIRWCIISLLGAKKHYDVIFYYPQHFNRSATGVNPFFVHLIETCKIEQISYLVFEEPDSNAKAPRNNDSVPFDAILYLIILLRKFIPFSSYTSFESREWHISRIIKRIFLRNITFKNFITISNSMLGIFRGLNPAASLFDVQHGILYSWHWGYISNGNPTDHIKLNNTKLLIAGKGFYKLLMKGNMDYYADHVVKIGVNNFVSSVLKKNNKKILITLTATTANENSKETEEFMSFIRTFLFDNRDFFIDNCLEFIIKPHPRYDGYLNLKWLYKLPFAKMCSTDLENVLNECSIHLTNYSTTAFEAAGKGLPCLFYKSELSMKLFRDEFCYPDFEQNTHILECLRIFEDELSFQKASSQAITWYRTYYQPYNPNEFHGALKQKN